MHKNIIEVSKSDNGNYTFKTYHAGCLLQGVKHYPSSGGSSRLNADKYVTVKFINLGEFTVVFGIKMKKQGFVSLPVAEYSGCLHAIDEEGSIILINSLINIFVP